MATIIYTLIATGLALIVFTYYFPKVMIGIVLTVLMGVLAGIIIAFFNISLGIQIMVYSLFLSVVLYVMYIIGLFFGGVIAVIGGYFYAMYLLIFKK